MLQNSTFATTLKRIIDCHKFLLLLPLLFTIPHNNSASISFTSRRIHKPHQGIPIYIISYLKNFFYSMRFIFIRMLFFHGLDALQFAAHTSAPLPFRSRLLPICPKSFYKFTTIKTKTAKTTRIPKKAAAPFNPDSFLYTL